MPRGGKRLGAGRKPLTRRERWLGGNAGKRQPLALVTPDRPVDEVQSPPAPVEVPGVLAPAEEAYWALWAGLAQARGLLYPETTPGFVLLCKQAARADAIWRCIEDRGYEQERVTIDGAGQEHREYKANSLISQWRGLMARIEQLQARYGLAADGKVPVSDGGQKDTERDELARLLKVQ